MFSPGFPVARSFAAIQRPLRRRFSRRSPSSGGRSSGLAPRRRPGPSSRTDSSVTIGGCSRVKREHSWATPRRPRLLMILHGFFPMEVRVAAEVRAASRPASTSTCSRSATRAGREEAEGARVPAAGLPRAWLGSGACGRSTSASPSSPAQGAPSHCVGATAIVQVHNPPDFLLVAARPAATGCADLFDVHDLAPDMFEMRFGEARRGVAERILRGSSGTRPATSVVTVHEPYRQELIARGARPAGRRRPEQLDDCVPPPLARRGRNGFRVVLPRHGHAALRRRAADRGGRGGRRLIPNLRLEIYGTATRSTACSSAARARDRDASRSPRTSRNGRCSGRSVGSRRRCAEPSDPPEPVRALDEALRVRRPGNSGRLGRPADDPGVFSDREVLYFRAGDPRRSQALADRAEDPDAAAARAAPPAPATRSTAGPMNAARYVGFLRRWRQRPVSAPTTNAGRPRQPRSRQLERRSRQ